MGIISSHPWAHFPVCATDFFSYFTTLTLKFIILHDPSYGSTLAANSKQRPSGGRPSGPAGLSYVSAVNVSLATWLLFPYRLITARGAESPQGRDAAHSEVEQRELSASRQPLPDRGLPSEFIGKCICERHIGVCLGLNLRLNPFYAFWWKTSLKRYLQGWESPWKTNNKILRVNVTLEFSKGASFECISTVPETHLSLFICWLLYLICTSRSNTILSKIGF